MFIHNIIKIKYVTLGFLPNLPYHLTSDKEMFDAFAKYKIEIHYDNDTEQINRIDYIPMPDTAVYSEGFFAYFYPFRASIINEIEYSSRYYPTTDNLRGYDILYRSICKHIDQYLYGTMIISEDKKSVSRDGISKPIPDWVYSYMLGEVVGPRSDKHDIHDVIYPLGTDNADDDYDNTSSIACYAESREYLLKTYPKKDMDIDTLDRTCIRPITMYGEPHVIKSLRLKQVTI